LNAPVEKLELIVDPGTYKNGAAVTIPNSRGQKGNVIAAAMGVVIAQLNLRLEILTAVTPEILSRAQALIDSGGLSYRCKEDEKGFHIEVKAEGGWSHAFIALYRKGIPTSPAWKKTASPSSMRILTPPPGQPVTATGSGQ
jgi:L-cysteine desulfidase